MSAETPGSDHDDTEAIRALLAEHESVGQIATMWDPIRQCYLRQWVCPCGESFTGLFNEVAAAREVHRALALAAYVARRVEAVERSNAALVEQVKRLQDQIARAAMEPGQDRQKAMHAYAERAEKAERERDEYRERFRNQMDAATDILAEDGRLRAELAEARAQVAAVKELAARWVDVLAECKQADPHWIIDQGVMALSTALDELRAALAPVTRREEGDCG